VRTASAIVLAFIFTLCSEGQTLSTLVDFAASTAFKVESVIQGSDGNYYGTTYGGGSGSSGTVFKMTPAGGLTILYNFTGGKDGAFPVVGLVQGTDGNFYGTTSGGGAKNAGSVFKITPGGTLTTLYSFGTNPNDGASPFASLIQASDGNFYGTTFQGGAGQAGTVFKITTAGVLTPLYGFHGLNGTDGGAPMAPLVQGSDGNFYGTTTQFTGNNGTVFKITPSGTLTTLYTFTGKADGANPMAGLTQGKDSNFYGTTLAAGANNQGTIFKITPLGALTTLHSFSGQTDGTSTRAALIAASDGSSYGVSTLTFFQMTAAGAVSTVLSLPFPPDSLIQAADGSFYGTTYIGGRGLDGTVFKVQLAASGTPVISNVISASDFGAFNYIAPGSWIEIYGTNLAPDAQQWAGSDFNGVNAPTSLDGVTVTVGGKSAYVAYISATQVNVQAAGNVSTGDPVAVMVTNSHVTSGASSSLPFMIQSNSAAPGLLAPPSFQVGGNQYVVALLPDGTYAAPTGSIAGIASRPAKPGETIVMYGVGFCCGSPYIPPGQIAMQQNQVLPPVIMQFGGVSGSIVYSGLAPGFVGLYQFNVVVPGAPDSDLTQLTVYANQVSGEASQPLYIAIHQ